MPMIIRYEGEVERQWPSRDRLRVVSYGPSGLAEGLEATGKAAEALREDLQRAKDIEAAREVWHQDLTAGEFWKSELDQALGTPGYKAEAVVAETEQRAPLVRDAILKRISTPEGRAVMARRWDEHRTTTLAKMNADALAKRREAEDALHQRQLNQFIQDFCEAPDGQGFDHIARGNDRIADHAQFNGLSEEWQQAERQAFAGSAIEACVRTRLERGDPAAAKSMLDWGGKVMTPKAAAELRPMVDLQLSQRQAERDADEVIGAVPSDDGSFDLVSGLARIEAQDWPEPRKAQAARELRFRNGEARRLREAGHDEAGRAFGALLDEHRAAGTPITSLKQIPVELRAKLRPEVLQEFDAALEAQDAGERPQPNSQLLGALTHLAVTDPDEFRRRLVHPDLLRGRVTDAEAAELWRTWDATEQGTDDGAPPQDILKLVEEEVGKASTPEEQATHGQIVFRVGQRVRRDFKDKPATQDHLRALVSSELANPRGALRLKGLGATPATPFSMPLQEHAGEDAPLKPASLSWFEGGDATGEASIRLASQHDPFEDPALQEQRRRYSREGIVGGIVEGVKKRLENLTPKQKKRKVDVSRPIIVGGGGDGYKILQKVYKGPVEQYISRDDRPNFYRHFEQEELRSAIAVAHAAGKPVVLIGHSWGGAAVISAALWAKAHSIPVDLLVTIDPVGIPNGADDSGGVPEGLARQWISVIAEKPGGVDNTIAEFGRRTPMPYQAGAEVIPDPKSTHGAFEQMLKTGNVEEAISRIYRSRRR